MGDHADIVTDASRRPRRERLDTLLLSRGLVETRNKAQALVMSGRVTCGGVRADKPGMRVDSEVELEIDPAPRYVSRGALKLAGAIASFGIGVEGRRAIDVGASTGGFTEVLLEAGAAQVIALDVGRGQLHWRLRTDPRVLVLDGVNARYLRPADLPFTPSLAVVDVSFISLERVLPGVLACLEPWGEALALVKPQFEVGRGMVGRGGIVRDAALHRQVLRRLTRFLRHAGAGVRGLAVSALPGAEGNVEFFVHVVPSPEGPDQEALDRAVDELAPIDERSKP